MAKQGFFPFYMEVGGFSPGAGQVTRRRWKTLGPLSHVQSLERSLIELVRTYRHASTGRLVTGIVHQMNTPLQVISFQLELLDQNELAEPGIQAVGPEPAIVKREARERYRREKLLQLRREVEKLQALSRRLILQGLHEEARDQQQIEFNRIVEDQLELYLAQPCFKHRVKRNVLLATGLPLLTGHYLDFAQSFRNLLDNALEAMEESARPELTVTTAFEDGCRVLSLQDTGTGIPVESRPMLFQPFFSTKPGHAGLGLFMARRLLAPYGGEIKVESAPGGTLVRLFLPVL